MTFNLIMAGRLCRMHFLPILGARPEDGGVCAAKCEDGGVCAAMCEDGCVCAANGVDGRVCAANCEDGGVCAAKCEDGGVCTANFASQTNCCFVLPKGILVARTVYCDLIHSDSRLCLLLSKKD